MSKEYFPNCKREIFIRKTLRQLSKQRVALILQPEGIWAVEKTLSSSDKVNAALSTCYLRGWVEIIEKAIPKGKLPKDGELPSQDIFIRIEPLYRLTEAGWNVIHRINKWIITTCVVACITLFATIIGIIINTG